MPRQALSFDYQHSHAWRSSTRFPEVTRLTVHRRRQCNTLVPREPEEFRRGVELVGLPDIKRQ
eukprot:2608579-Pyramimonas_sp.AAC.1